MFNKSEQWEWIEAYLNGQLSGSELQEFTKQLQTDNTLLEAIQAHQELLDLMEIHEVQNIKNHAKSVLSKIHEQENESVEKVKIIDLQTEEDIEDVEDIEEVLESNSFSEQTTAEEPIIVSTPPTDSTKKEQTTPKVANIRRGWSYYAMLAAAMLLLALIPYYLYDMGMFTPKVAPTQLAESHYEAPAQLSTSVKRTSLTNARSEVDSLYQIANQLYLDKSYDKALLVLQQLPISDSVLLDKGICFFQTQNIIKAIEQFKEVVKHTDTSVEVDDQAEWYLVLAYLKAEKVEEAKTLLQSMVKQKNWRSSEARQMLRQLK